VNQAIIFVGGAAIGAGVGIVWMRRQTGRAAREIEAGFRRWSEGDLSAPMEPSKLAGFPSLAGLFEAAQEKVRGVIGEKKRELSRERQKLETLILNIPDGLVLTDLHGDVIAINPPALEVLGVKAEEAAGRRVTDLVKGNEFRMKIQDILKNHTHSDTIELQVQKAGGPVSGYFKTTVALFSTPGGEEMGVMLILRDVTAQRSLDALKEEFFQSVAHDLRAPLFAMQGYLRLLEKSIHPDAHQKGYFDAISKSCEKLTLFIQDTLDSARIATGQMKLAVSPVDPVILVQRAVSLFRPLAEEKAIRLEFTAPERGPATIDVDERLMERVFYNLLSNALKFTPRGGSIKIGMSQAGENLAEFSVADTGPGIPPNMRTQIFEKFRQVENAASRSGFGLGLNICSKIVKLHRGLIWVDSEPGMGSQFVLRIPIRQEGGSYVSSKSS
jgi:two-component system phosphate regulon sensor histidine kinase PhoR